MPSTFQFPSASAHTVRQRPLRLVASWMASLALGFVLTGCGSGPSAATPAQPVGAVGEKSAAKPAAAAAEPTPVKPAEVSPKSVFRTDLRAGLDPFFPKSERRHAKSADTAAAASLPLVSYLKLVGIRSGTTRPMALINRTPFSPGEEGNVSIVVSNQFSQPELQKINIRCLEIRRDSVLINIAGEPGAKELRMAQGR